MKYIYFNFAGILQYYAKPNGMVCTPREVRYPTSLCPTKNAVVGMVGAVLGIDRADTEGLDYLRRSLTIKYRTTREGRVYTDFQRARQYTPSVKLVEYLSGYHFDVYIGGDEELLRRIYDAFLCPVYIPYFGKKCCTTNEDMIPETFELLSEEEIGDVHDCP
ncbi:MAG: hypothetical protein IJ796_09220 [Lachnospiraceae bacterium]|nr:hypothetical protein [Lachnospiraceae bacterium]